MQVIYLACSALKNVCHLSGPSCELGKIQPSSNYGLYGQEEMGSVLRDLYVILLEKGLCIFFHVTVGRSDVVLYMENWTMSAGSEV